MSLLKVFLMLVFSLLLLSACKVGNGVGLDEQGRPLSETAINTGNDKSDIEGNLLSIQQHIFTPICSSCHGGVSPAAGQDLSSIEKSIDNLINVSSSNSEFKRVLPGESELSYLYLKVIGDAKAGAQMPLGQPALNEEMITAIKTWINQGALLPNGINAPVRVSRVKDNGADFSNNKNINALNKSRINREINLWFNKAMDFSGLTNVQLKIHAIYGPQLVEAESNELQPDSTQYSLSIPSEAFTLEVIDEHQIKIVLNIDAVMQVNEPLLKVSIELNSSDISTITSKSGQELDGDFDGIDGGVYHYDVNY